MVNYARVQAHIDYGLGKAGNKLGAPFDGYRAGTGDFPSGWTKIVSKLPVWRIRCTETKIPSALKGSATVFSQIIGDMRAALLGDVFVNVDAAYVSGVSYGAGAAFVSGTTLQLDGFALAWHGPVEIPIAARLDRRAKIYRPLQAVQTMTDGVKAWRQTSDQALALTLAGGTFSFGTGAASFVPIGISSTERPPQNENFKPGFPGTEKVPRYYAFVPWLNGYEPTEGDRIHTEDGAMYRVVNPYEQEVGVSGSQLHVERVIGQNA